MRILRIGIVAALCAILLAVPAAAQLESTIHSDEPAHKHKEVTLPPQGRFDEAKRKVCETRIARIATVLQTAANKGERTLTLFKNINDRVVAFYDAKKLNIANYSALSASVKSKYDTANAAITKVKAAGALDCAGENPQAAIDQLKTEVVAIHNALKDYRAAVHMMLVAVKTATGGNTQ